MFCMILIIQKNAMRPHQIKLLAIVPQGVRHFADAFRTRARCLVSSTDANDHRRCRNSRRRKDFYNHACLREARADVCDRQPSYQRGARALRPTR